MDTEILFGSEVKATESGKVSGHLVLFSTKHDPDISHMRDFFTPETDYDLDFSTKSRVLYSHGFDVKVGNRKLGVGEMKMDDAGVWIEAQLSLRDEYEQAVFELARKGKLGWSSGVPAHLVRREKQDNGSHKVLAWPLGLDASLTPNPAEPRTCASVKSLFLEGKSIGLSLDNKREILQRALMEKLKADTAESEYLYAYVEDVFDSTVVWRQDGRDSGTYEAEYALSGVTATIGDPQRVQRVVSYRALQEGMKSLSAQHYTERDCQRLLRDAAFPTSIAFKMSEFYKSLRLRDAEEIEDAEIVTAQDAYAQCMARLALNLDAIGVSLV